MNSIVSISMKKVYCILLLLTSVLVAAQTGDSPPASIVTDMPQITPPSPTVGALMKFEEVPVNNYTGIPDVSIPLYRVESTSKDIVVDLTLKYHPLSIQKDENAGYTGLGWSLLAGGSISRTVRGFPDEIISEGSPQGPGPDKTRIGIYNDHLASPYYANKYYQVMGLLGNFSTEAERDLIGEYFWKAFEKGLYDSDHDLYQFNFMGKSGRFYIKKNITTGVLEIVRLDNDNAVRIELHYTFQNNQYTISGFTAYDDKGYKYLFNDVEMTTETTLTSSTSFKDLGGLGISGSYPLTYSSSFQLSQVLDNNNQPLISFSYSTVAEKISQGTNINNAVIPAEFESQLTQWLNHPSNNIQISGLLPKNSYTSKTIEIATKKLSNINVWGKGSIAFTNQAGRTDTRLHNMGTKLKTITVSNILGDIVKQYEFNYDYTLISLFNNNQNLNRLILTEVVEKSTDGLKEHKHRLYYKHQYSNGYQINMDKWGYTSNSNLKKPVSSIYDGVGVLEKLSLPTGGCVIFDFGSNTYSHIGDEAITDFSTNPDNWEYTTEIKGPYTHTGTQLTMTISLGVLIDGIRYLKHERSITPPATYEGEYLANVFKKELNNQLTSQIDRTEDGYMILEAGYEYVMQFSRSNRDVPATLYLTLHYKKPKQVPVSHFNGGGIRINRIAYFDTNMDQEYYLGEEYYESIGALPSKEKIYNYNFFNTAQSSGSLVFPEPVFSYEVYHPAHSRQVAITGVSYLSTTDYNNLQSTRTQGADVGYKNVTVKVKGDAEGKTEYTYRSPIDYPEEHYTVNYPFIPSINKDFNRGQLVKEIQYKKENNLFKPVSETDYTYSIDSVMVVTGIRSNNVSKCPQAASFTFYSEFKHCVSTTCASTGPIMYCDTNYFLSFHTIYDSFGWSRPASKTTKNYFYEGSGTQIVTTQEHYTYNPVNKKLASQTLQNSTGDILTSNYYYDMGASAARNRVSEIERIEIFKGATPLSKSKILYSNGFAGNTAYLPQQIQTSKSTDALETRVQYNLYDSRSNVLEVQQPDGTKVSYIWGYHHTQPVAKLENIAYSSIPGHLITAIQNATDALTYNEATVITALNNLRADASVSQAMITTLTHIPLVGVSKITDPKGDTATYRYDAFNRLKEVRDKDNAIINEHTYHYRP